MARALRRVAIAVATGRIGYVLFRGDRPLDWGMSRRASKRPAAAAKQTAKWIDRLQPDVVVTEKLAKTSRKGVLTKAIIEAIQRVAADAPLLDIQVSRTQTHRNKYEEAKHLASLYSELAPYLPTRRRLWESEPREIVYVEAMSLLLETAKDPKNKPSLRRDFTSKPMDIYRGE